MSTSGEPNKLRFNYATLALGAGALLAAAVLGLNWLNERLAESEVAEIRAKLCAELDAELLSALQQFVRDETDSAASGKRAWVILDGKLNLPHERDAEVRVLQHTDKGWREWRRWTEEANWAYAEPLLELLADEQCNGAVQDGTVRVVRRVHTNGAPDVLLVAERKRE